MSRSICGNKFLWVCRDDPFVRICCEAYTTDAIPNRMWTDICNWKLELGGYRIGAWGNRYIIWHWLLHPSKYSQWTHLITCKCKWKVKKLISHIHICFMHLTNERQPFNCNVSQRLGAYTKWWIFRVSLETNLCLSYILCTLYCVILSCDILRIDSVCLLIFISAC